MAYDAVGGGPDGAPRARGRRPVTDYGATVLNWLHNWRPSWQGGYGGYGAEMERASPNYIIKMLPPSARVARGADSVPNKHLHASLNKAKHPINVVRWTPEGRRLLTASTSGEFTLWNGTGFNFETIMQAHDAAVRAAQWSHSADWLVSADHDGFVKYWQPNFNNVQSIQAHDQPIRDLAFSPNDAKFVTASDDSTLKLFDFAAGLEEATLTGHGWDVKSADWHPTRSLIASGSKDHLVKLWDPREGGRCLATLHGHKNTITKVQFEPVRGMCLATAARDQVARVLDLRMMRDIALLRGNDKDISTLAFHPIHPMLLTTGGQHGAILHYLLDEQHPPEGQAATLAVYDSPDPATAPAQTVWPAHRVPFAHEMAVWTLDWHPTGHILASGSNDRITRFWTRARPGDRGWLTDRYHVGGEADGGGGGGRDRRGGPAPYGDRARARMEEEQQEMEDETDALVDQNREAQTRAQAAAAAAVPGLATLPGLHLPSLGGGIPGLPLHSGAPPPPSRLPLHLHPSGPSSSAAAIPGVGSGTGPLGAAAEGANRPPPPPPPFLLFPPPGLDPSHPPPDIAEIAAMIKRAGIKLPPPGSLPPGILPPPPPPLPGMAGGGFQVPGLGGAMATTTTAPTAPAGLAFGESASSSPSGDPISSGVRRRGPLPTQEESLRMEQSKGKYTRPR